MKLELGYGWNALQRDCTCFFWPMSVWNEEQILQLAWDVQGGPKTWWTIHNCGTVYKGIMSESIFWNFINSHLRERTGWMIAKKPHNELTPACTITALEQAPWGFGYLRSLSINSSILRINRFTSLPLFMLARLMRMSSFASLNPRRDIELSLVSKTLVRLFYFLFFLKIVSIWMLNQATFDSTSRDLWMLQLITQNRIWISIEYVWENSEKSLETYIEALGLDPTTQISRWGISM